MSFEKQDDQAYQQELDRKDRDHGHDGDKDRDYHKCKKERDEYKKEREEWKKAAWKYKKELGEYKAFVKDALERLGIAARKLDHLQHELVDEAKKLGKHHDKDHDKDHDHGKGRD